ncbi:toll-like receptor 13 [Haliotis cracherodii]|uniref:toll-like receptor 13 n=1 Tax=Haliotis cracherodii TaxID=6455 RepID=UPI0039E85D69
MEKLWHQCIITVLCFLTVCQFQQGLAIDCFHNWCSCISHSARCIDNGRRLQYVPRLQWDGEIYRYTFMNNYLTIITNSTFQNISQYALHSLDLTHNQITHISAGAFANLSHLLYLDISDNPITLDELGGAFHSLPVGFEYLYLNKLNISDAWLEDNFLDGLLTKSLTELHLAHNVLTKFNVSHIAKFTMLTLLNLTDNQIAWPEYHKTAKSESLKSLDLSHNELGELPLMCMEHQKPSFPNLQTLNIGYNLIYAISALNVHCLHNLQALTLSGNIIGDIKKFSLLRITKLRQLDISDNKANLTIQGQVFNSNLSFVNLSYSNIRSIETSAFINCKSIEEVDLSGNDLGRMPQYFFRYLFGRAVNTIESFNCSRCGLKQMPRVISEMGRLRILNLNVNSIQTINDNFFDSNNDLRQLYLANNSIKTLSTFVISKSVRKELQFISLENNPFVCNCDLVWLKYWLLSETSKFRNHLNQYTCSNAPFQGKNLVDVSSINDSECYHTRHKFSIVYCVVGTVLICLCFFALGYKLRWNIRYCCLMSKSSASESIPLLSNDVYILYSDENYLWVRYEALAKLEDEGRLKVCFRQRDFNPKIYVVDNVVTNLRRCIKVLAVLSNSFFKDRASQFEMSLVLKRLEGHQGMLVLVFLEDIEDRYMSHALSSLLQTCPTVQWSEKSDRKDAFWEQLLTHL